MTVITSRENEEILVASFLLATPEVYDQFQEEFRKYPFGIPWINWITQMAITYREKYGKFPGNREMAWIIENSPGVELDHQELLLQYCSEIYDSDPTGVSYEMVTRYIIDRKQEYIQDKLTDGGEEALDEAISILSEIKLLRYSGGTSESSLTSPFGDDAITRTAEYTDEGVYVPTGYPGMDLKLQGGLRRGELALCVIPTGHGKSLLMIATATKMSEAGFRVLYIVLDNPRQEVELRAQESLVGKSMLDFPSPQDFAEALQEKLENMDEDPSRLFICKTRADFASTPNATDILHMMRSLERDKELIEYDEQRGVDEEYRGKFDVVFIDYPDKMASNDRGRRHSARWERLGAILENLQALGICTNSCIFAVSQVTRAGLDKEEVSLGDIAGAIDKINPAGLVALYAQTPAEERAGVFRLRFVKTRRRERFQVAFETNPGACQVVEVSGSCEPLASRVTTRKRTNQHLRKERNVAELTEVFRARKQGLSTNPALQ